MVAGERVLSEAFAVLSILLVVRKDFLVVRRGCDLEVETIVEITSERSVVCCGRRSLEMNHTM